MKILIAGCNGLLGQSLLRTAAAGGEVELSGLGLEETPRLPQYLASYDRADLGEREALQAVLARRRPDWIFNAAAYTDVDGCEKNPALNDHLNRELVGWMAETGLPLVQISTDYVFDGQSGPYAEGNPVHPLNQYGCAKLASEALVLAGSPRSLVLRTMWLWGALPGAKKSFTEFVRETLAAGKPVRAVTDQIGNPTWAEDLALAVWALLRRGCSGLYHAAGSDLVSRLTWARAVAEFYGLDAGLIQAIRTEDLRLPAARPLRSGLDCSRLERDTGMRLRGLHAQLESLDPAAVKE